MRILFITEQIPYPLDTGGNVRTFHILSSLVTRHDVELLATIREPENPQATEILGRMCKKLHVITLRKRSLLREALLAAKLTFFGGSILLDRHRHPEVSRVIRQIFTGKKKHSGELHEDSIDAVYFNHLDAANYSDLIPKNIVRVLDQHNVVSSQVQSLQNSDMAWYRRAILRREFQVLQKIEPKLCNEMTLCLACSGVDANSLRSLGVIAPIAEVPNGVDTSEFSMNSNHSKRAHEIIFVGTMDYLPCDQGMWYFLNSILPLIHAVYSDLHVKVIGRNPSRRIREFASRDHRIHVSGRVDDVRPHVRNAKVCIVPLLSGSGTRLKILEAFALGTPVVSTTIGAEGLAATHGKHILVSDSVAGFAQYVLDLVRDEMKAAAIANEARKLVEHLYDWAVIGQRLLNHLPDNQNATI